MGNLCGELGGLTLNRADELTPDSADEKRTGPVERRANLVGISLRSGCHCNPGVREVALGFCTREMAAAFKGKDRLRYEEFLQVIDGKTTGAARASIGLVTTFADVYRFWEFAGASATYQVLSTQ